MCLVMAPIYLSVQEDFLFYIENILFIVIFLTFARVIFLTKFHWFDHMTSVKTILIFIVIPILLYLVDNIMDFQTYVDDYGVNAFLEKLPAENQLKLGKYIKSEYIFFWTAAMISCVTLPIKMIRSIWRMKNKL